MSFQLGFTLLSATQGVNSALSPLFFVKAKKQRGGKGKKINKRERERERERGFYLFLPCFSTIKREERDNASFFTSSLLDFRQQRREGKTSLHINIYIYIYIFGRCEKRKKKPFCSSSVVPFLLPLSAFERLPSSSCVHG